MIPKIEELISEKALAQALGISRASLLELRHKGLPWVSIAGKVFYYEPIFMDWILKKGKRVSENGQSDTPEE
jgi:hypothetical protein